MAPVHAPIALCAGEPAGIGPDLCLSLAATARAEALVVHADSTLLAERARRLGQHCRFEPYVRGQAPSRAAQVLTVRHIPLGTACVPGQLAAGNARHVLALIDTAVDGALSGEYAALVTAPVQKSLICAAGIPFTGHTEYIAERTGAALPVMLLVADALRVALATTHLPLRAVPDALNPELLVRTLQILSADLQRYWHLNAPRIAVCGLNPHAGEGGHLGTEEQRIIAPAIARARALGIEAEGPFSADTLFVPEQVAPYAAVLAMYHDQGLPVLKRAGFGAAVNVTLGLPIVRTSVDHGTALALAGSGRADAGSLRAAISLAAAMTRPA